MVQGCPKSVAAGCSLIRLRRNKKSWKLRSQNRLQAGKNGIIRVLLSMRHGSVPPSGVARRAEIGCRCSEYRNSVEEVDGLENNGSKKLVER
jgi:hypothetical protein